MDNKQPECGVVVPANLEGLVKSPDGVVPMTAHEKSGAGGRPSAAKRSGSAGLSFQNLIVRERCFRLTYTKSPHTASVLASRRERSANSVASLRALRSSRYKKTITSPGEPASCTSSAS